MSSKRARGLAVLLTVVSHACAFTSQTPVPSGWQPVDSHLPCDEHIRWVALDALLAAPAFVVGATDVGAGGERATNYALITLGALHVASGLYGLGVRGQCKRAKLRARESAVGSLRQADRWWMRDTPCPDGASLTSTEFDDLQCQRPDGTLHGPMVDLAYKSDTQRVREYHYVDGVLHGPFREWYLESEQLWRQGEYREGALLLDRLRQWDSVGRPIQPDYGTGLVARWLGDTKLAEGMYVDGQPDGEWTTWNELGEVVERGVYRAGRPEGTWTSWHAGVAREQVDYRGGIEHGAITRWGPDGRVTEIGSYSNGRPDSWWTYYDDDGVVAMEGSFVDGERNGQWTYYDAGARIEQGSFVRGLREGSWRRWTAAGQLIDERRYSQDLLVE